MFGDKDIISQIGMEIHLRSQKLHTWFQMISLANGIVSMQIKSF